MTIKPATPMRSGARLLGNRSFCRDFGMGVTLVD
jgi:hypothetical protein